MSPALTHSDVGAISIQGARERQEDSFCVADCERSHRPIGEVGSVLIAVADGLGGHAAGQVASGIVIDSLIQSVQAGYKQMSNVDLLIQSVRTANSQIRAASESEPTYRGMASTIVAAIIEGNGADWISVGDGHVVVVGPSTYERLNTPHRLVPEPAADRPPPTNVLLSCLNGHEISQIEVSDGTVEIRNGCFLMLASDGIETLDDTVVSAIACRSSSAQEFAEALAAGVADLMPPDQDNTTVVVLRPVSPTDPVQGTR